MSEITAADASEAIIKLASIGASKFSSTFDKELLERAISAFTSDRDVSRLRGLAMVGSSTKEEVAFVDSVMSAFEATS